VKETDQRATVAPEDKKRSFVLAPLVGIYLLSLLITLSNLDAPFVLMGKLYSGESAESYAFLDCIISLYLVVGIVKRQRLTLWLLIAINTLKGFNEIANLLLLPAHQMVTVSGMVIPDYQYRLTAFGMAVVFLLLNVFLYVNRRHFDNKSIYLW
jgi:hypothetical protein